MSLVNPKDNKIIDILRFFLNKHEFKKIEPFLKIIFKSNDKLFVYDLVLCISIFSLINLKQLN
jgi:hypothetical protein